MSDLGYPIAHAWVVDAGGRDHDLTLRKMPKVYCKKVYDKHQVRRKILDTGAYDQMDYEWCSYMLNAAHMRLPADLPYERILEMLDPMRDLGD